MHSAGGTCELGGRAHERALTGWCSSLNPHSEGCADGDDTSESRVGWRCNAGISGPGLTVGMKRYVAGLGPLVQTCKRVSSELGVDQIVRAELNIVNVDRGALCKLDGDVDVAAAGEHGWAHRGELGR